MNDDGGQQALLKLGMLGYARGRKVFLEVQARVK